MFPHQSHYQCSSSCDSILDGGVQDGAAGVKMDGEDTAVLVMDGRTAAGGQEDRGWEEEREREREM